MLAMASGGLGLYRVAENLKQTGRLAVLEMSSATSSSTSNGSAAQPGTSIQPSFMFMVGVAMAYSCASRQAHGQSYGQMLRHALVRSWCWCCWACSCGPTAASRRISRLRMCCRRSGWATRFCSCCGTGRCGCSFGRRLAFWPAIGPVLLLSRAAGRFRLLDSVGVGARLAALGRHRRTLGQEHERGRTISIVWFLNLFPREKPFHYNGGGYLTLSFIPSLATMIFGLISGELLRSGWSDRRKFWLSGRGRRRWDWPPAGACKRPALPDRQTHLDAELGSI